MNKRKSTASGSNIFVHFDMQGNATLVRKANGLPDVHLSDFKVTHLLGQGAFGKVFYATLPPVENGNNKRYAIKTIRKDRLVDNPASIPACNIEYQILFQATNPFLCTMDYFFHSNERFYFVMDLVEGGSLQAHHRYEGRF